jgi:hypothetical protein
MRRQKVPALPQEVWQTVAQLMGPRAWAQHAASVCRAFRDMPLDALSVSGSVCRGGRIPLHGYNLRGSQPDKFRSMVQ